MDTTYQIVLMRLAVVEKQLTALEARLDSYERRGIATIVSDTVAKKMGSKILENKGV